MTRRRWDYFVQNLQGNTPPPTYQMQPWSATRKALGLPPNSDDE